MAISVLALAQAAVLTAVVVGVATPRSREDTPIRTPHSAVTASSRRIDSTPMANAAETSPAGLVSVEAMSALGRSLIMPVVGVVSSSLHDGFNERRSAGRMHEALDIMAPRGTPVVSAAEGRLLRLHHSKAGGLMVYAADATDRFILMYAHLDRYASGLVEGAPLHQGQLLGYVGTTGNAPPNAPHLHFALARGQPSVRWWKGVAVNPFPLLLHASPSVAPAVQLAADDEARQSRPASVALRADTAVTARRRSVTRQLSTKSSQHSRTSASSREQGAQRSRAVAVKPRRLAGPR